MNLKEQLREEVLREYVSTQTLRDLSSAAFRSWNKALQQFREYNGAVTVDYSQKFTERSSFLWNLGLTANVILARRLSEEIRRNIEFKQHNHE